ncbi:hypothetical protein C8R44DRAFT_819854 [Mycena epipterygia]|nr:hypothetical protein C8R44DRAFT_819854 [Mycena epipterygia]
MLVVADCVLGSPSLTNRALLLPIGGAESARLVSGLLSTLPLPVGRLSSGVWWSVAEPPLPPAVDVDKPCTLFVSAALLLIIFIGFVAAGRRNRLKPAKLETGNPTGLVGLVLHPHMPLGALQGLEAPCQDCWPADPGLLYCTPAVTARRTWINPKVSFPSPLRISLPRFLSRARSARSVPFGGLGLRADHARLLPVPEPGYVRV